jgi:transcriptional regulator with XRE-family HTH domain
MKKLDDNTPMLSLAIQNGLVRIKQELKARGIKYSELAELMDMSEVTVKRMLNSSNISLSRMMFLGELLKLDLTELLTPKGKAKATQSFFTEEQDQAFFEKPKLWSYFVELFYNRKSPPEIEREHALTALSTYQYLRELENLKLIHLNPKNNVDILVKAPIGFNRNSKVINRHISHMMEVSYKAVMDDDEENDDYFLRVKPMRLTQPVYLKLIEELKAVMDKYSEVSEVAFSNSNEAKDYQVVFTGHRLIVEDYETESL